MSNISIIWGFSIIWFFVTAALLWVVGFTEFSYLGSKTIQRLYNLFAPIYQLKWLSPFYTSKKLNEKLFLSPLKSSLENKKEAQVLDLACGSGRLSLILLQQSWFKGHIEAVDFSEGMLQQLKNSLNKLESKQVQKITISQADLNSFQAVAAKYDVVVLTEVSEFLPNFPSLVEQIRLSLKEGGLFLLTKPPEWLAWMYFGRKQSQKELTNLLLEQGFTGVQIHQWSPRYDVVHSWKK